MAQSIPTSASGFPVVPYDTAKWYLPTKYLNHWRADKTYDYARIDGTAVIAAEGVVHGGRVYLSKDPNNLNQEPAPGGTAYWQDMGAFDDPTAVIRACHEQTDNLQARGSVAGRVDPKGWCAWEIELADGHSGWFNVVQVAEVATTPSLYFSTSPNRRTNWAPVRVADATGGDNGCPIGYRPAHNFFITGPTTLYLHNLLTAIPGWDTGNSLLTGVKISNSSGDLIYRMAVEVESSSPVRRAGETLPITITWGGDELVDGVARNAGGLTLTVDMIDRRNGQAIAGASVVWTVPTSSTPVTEVKGFPVPATADGPYVLHMRETGKSTGLALEISVVDVAKKPTVGEIEMETLFTLDMVAMAPDLGYSDTVDLGVLGVYRRPTGTDGQSTRGWVTDRPESQMGDWCGWEIDLTPYDCLNEPLLVEAHFPDDGMSANMVWVWPDPGFSYQRPLEVSCETGLEHRVSNGVIIAKNVFRLHSNVVRVLIANMHGRTPCRCSKVVFKRITNTKNCTFACMLPVPEYSPAGKNLIRQVGFAFEEGDAWRGQGLGRVIFSNEGPEHLMLCDAYFNRLAFGGINRVQSSLVSYGTPYYASAMWEGESYTAPDTGVHYMLMGERHGLDVDGEVSGFYLWDIIDRHGMSSLDDVLSIYALGNGDVWNDRPNSVFDYDALGKFSPYLDCSSPLVREALITLATEVAEKFVQYPRFRGISLMARVWRNEGSWNWGANPHRNGYGDATMTRMMDATELTLPDSYDFTVPHGEQYSGVDLRVGSTSPYKYAGRYAYLWPLPAFQAWRKQVVTDTITALRDALQSVDPRLGVVLLNYYDPNQFDLADAGIDPMALSALDGVTVAFGYSQYGRRKKLNEYSIVTSWLFWLQVSRNLESICNGVPQEGAPAALLRSFQYQEGNMFNAKTAWNLPYTSADTKVNITSSLFPPPQSLWRDFTFAMASGNIQLLISDGGDKVVTPGIGDPNWENILRQYTAVPTDVPLERYATDLDPLAVVYGVQPGTGRIYARLCNLEQFTLPVTLRTGATIYDAVTGADLGVTVALTLAPYETRSVWSLNPIQTVIRSVPSQETELLADLLAQARTIWSTMTKPDASDLEVWLEALYGRLKPAVDEAEALFAEGKHHAALERLQRYDVSDALADLEREIIGLLSQTTPAAPPVLSGIPAATVQWPGGGTLLDRLRSMFEIMSGKRV